jgi:Family of unknown function (DUF6174)
MRFLALITATLVAFAACTPSAPATDAPQGGGSVAAAQATWEARRPAAYAYDLTIACMCIHRGEYRVEVRNGEITSVHDATTGAPSPESRVEWIVTVDRLFELMQQASAAGTPVRAVYHPQLGYPTEAEVGMLADDSGTLYTIQNLRAL